MAIFTKNISESECIGDSLNTINENFLSLDTQVYDVAIAQPGINTSVTNYTTLQNKTVTVLEPNNTLYFSRNFDYVSEVQDTNIEIEPTIVIPTKAFEKVGVNAINKPTGTMIVPALGSGNPQLTVYWTATGSDYKTNVFSLSASIPNGKITALHQENNILYIGGNFNTVNGEIRNGFAMINLSGGEEVVTEDYTDFTGSLIDTNSDIITEAGGFRIDEHTSVNVIKKHNNFLFVGGNFIQDTQTDSRAANLLIVDENTKAIYGFYVNGVVNDIYIDTFDANNTAYVVGEFDYIQKTGSTIQHTNGIAKILIDVLISNPAASLNDNFVFHEFIKNLFSGPAIINSIQGRNQNLYIGGKFVIKNNSQQKIASNILQLTNEALEDMWQPLLNGVVNKLQVLQTENGDSYLLVAGDFSEYDEKHHFYQRPIAHPSYKVHNLIKFSLDGETIPVFSNVWNIRFNGSIKTIHYKRQNQTDVVYCYGTFTTINETSVNYLAAVDMNENSSEDPILNWHPAIQTGASRDSNALLATDSGVYLGGSFRKINNTHRDGLAKLSLFSGSGTSIPESFDLEAGFEIIGSNLQLDSSTAKTVSVKCVSYPAKSIISSTFPRFSSDRMDLVKGQLCRFYIRRPRSNETENSPRFIYVLGYSINFDK